MRYVLIMTAAFSLFTGLAFGQAPQKPAICVVGRWGAWLTVRMDATYQKKLNALGYQVGALDYGEVTAERLKPFNVLLLQWAPAPGDTEGCRAYRGALPALREFVQSGGGILVTCEEAYDSYRTVNELLQPFGAEILPENVVDEKTLYRQQRYLQWYFCSTVNIAAHPITEGVKELWYPLSHHPEQGRGTLALRVTEEWQAVVHGNASARPAKGTLASAPPIVAVRQVGKGRVVVFPSHATFWTHAGYHRIWENLCFEKGDGFRFFTNIYNWLSEPSLQSGAFGGYVEVPTPAPRPALPSEGVASTDLYNRYLAAGGKPFVKEITHKRDNRKDFVGLVGARTSYSNIRPNDYGGGCGSVAEYCERARKLGYSFLVFTEDFRAMDAEKWGKLVGDCKAQTKDDFIAIPGVEYQDTWDNHYVAFNLPRWPEKGWLSEDGQRVKDTPGIYFGLDWPPIYLMSPRQNFHPPWLAKFYSGLEVVSYTHGDRKVDEAFDWLRRVQGNDYNLIPIVNHRLASPPELDLATGYKTHVRAEKVADIPDGFKYYWYAPRRSYVSSGPLLREWAIENGRGGYREEPWRVYLHVQSQEGLREVIVYDKERVYRRFDPHGAKEFKTELDGYHDRQHFLTLEGWDTKGGHLVSGALYVSDLRQSVYMCTDLQNTLNCMQDIDPPSGKFTYFGVLGGHVTGWDSLHPGILAAEWEIFPQGLDYAVKGFGGGLSHLCHTEGGPEYCTARREMPFACGDCNMLDNYYETTCRPGSFPTPTSLASSRARMISFTPRPYSYNLMLIEQDITFKRDLKFPPRDGPEVVGLTVGGPPEVFNNFVWVSGDGSKQGGKRTDPATVKEGTLNPGGYVALYPDFYGSFGVYPLDKSYVFRLEGATVSAGFDFAGKSVKAGEKVRGRWLVVRGKFGASEQDDLAGFEELRQLYGFAGKPAYDVKMQRGKVESQVFTLSLQAERYVAAATVTPAPLPNDLPLIVHGLAENWDAGMLDLDTKELRRCGVFEGAAYLTLDINKKTRRFAIGNLLTCDNRETRLSLLKDKGGWRVEAHNPTKRPVKATVRVADWLAGLVPKVEVPVNVLPGETCRKELR